MSIPIREQSNATPPVPINISTLPLRFVVKGRISKVLAADPGYALGQLLTLTETEADQLSTTWKSFQLLDESVPSVPVPIWSGKIRRGT